MHQWTVRHDQTRDVLAEGTADEAPTARRDARTARDRLVEDHGYPSAYNSPLTITVVPMRPPAP